MFIIVSVTNAEGPPVPIPNTEVKLCSAEDTRLATARENRSMLTQSRLGDTPKGVRRGGARTAWQNSDGRAAGGAGDGANPEPDGRGLPGRTCKAREKSGQTVGVTNAEGPPVPIPNTEVKLCSADNTWLATAREDRSMPTQRGCISTL